MKLINLILLLLPLTGFSQVDSVVLGKYKIVGDQVYTKVLPKPKLYKLPEVDTLPSGFTTSQDLRYYGGSNWYDNWSTELVKGKVETPVNVMDSGMKIEVVETRDTVYNCPYSNITYFTSNGSISKGNRPRLGECKLEKVITTRRYKLYIINEHGQKEYLSMELTNEK